MGLYENHYIAKCTKLVNSAEKTNQNELIIYKWGICQCIHPDHNKPTPYKSILLMIFQSVLCSLSIKYMMRQENWKVFFVHSWNLSEQSTRVVTEGSPARSVFRTVFNIFYGCHVWLCNWKAANNFPQTLFNIPWRDTF